MADHAKLLADTADRHPDFDWDDFLPPVRDLASYQGKLLGIPYRVTTSILTYQKQLLADAGFAAPPADWDTFLAAAQATTKPPERYGLGIWGRQGPAMLGGYHPIPARQRRPLFRSQDDGDRDQQRQSRRGAGILRRPDDAVQSRRPRQYHLGI